MCNRLHQYKLSQMKLHLRLAVEIMWSVPFGECCLSATFMAGMRVNLKTAEMKKRINEFTIITKIFFPLKNIFLEFRGSAKNSHACYGVNSATTKNSNTQEKRLPPLKNNKRKFKNFFIFW